MSASSGAQAQVALRGPLDSTTMSPRETTFFRAVYTRHTNFASAEAEQACNNTPNFGRSNIQTTIQRSGDLLSQMYLYMELNRFKFLNAGVEPAAAGTLDWDSGNCSGWVNGIGYAAINELTCLIGQHDFDTQDGRYMYMREAAASKSDRRLGAEVGLYPTQFDACTASLLDQKLYTPLQFWFNNFLEQSLPMIGLYWHELRVDSDLKNAADLYVQLGTHGTLTVGQNVFTCTPPTTLLPEMHFLCNFQYLDRPERAMFANQKLEQIFGQVQYLGEETYLATDNFKQVSIRWNHPVTDIQWVLQSDAARAANDWFNFGGVEFRPVPVNGGDTAPVLIAQPFESAQIFLNTHNRTVELPSVYFNSIPAHRAHTRIPRAIADNFTNEFISTYPLGVDPDGLLHSGSINFSRMDSAYVRFKLWHDTAAPPANSWNAAGNAQVPWAHAGSINIYGRNVNLAKVSIGTQFSIIFLTNWIFSLFSNHNFFISSSSRHDVRFPFTHKTY